MLEKVNFDQAPLTSACLKEGLIFVGGLIFHASSIKKIQQFHFFSKNDSRKFYAIKLFYFKNH